MGGGAALPSDLNNDKTVLSCRDVRESYGVFWNLQICGHITELRIFMKN